MFSLFRLWYDSSTFGWLEVQFSLYYANFFRKRKNIFSVYVRYVYVLIFVLATQPTREHCLQIIELHSGCQYRIIYSWDTSPYAIESFAESSLDLEIKNHVYSRSFNPFILNL